ncbi:MAG: hypothetical protein IIV86_05940 [Bacteroidaceae bacterium]|nr:hypothetical protein [Bacteroidaceae bacterium]
MNNIYTIEDELTPQPVTTDVDNTSATPDLQQQLGALEAQRQADLDHINRNYQDLNQEYDDQLDIIDNLHKTVSRRKVVDPRAVQARQALGSLYDTIQLIGSAASMAGKTTPPAPQLTSAQAQQNTIADRLYAAQRQADQDYTTQLQHITRQQQQARADIAKQRRQSKTEADRMRLNTNKHYDTLSTRLTEGEAKRIHETKLAVFREANRIKRGQEKLSATGVKNSEDFIPYENNYYKIDAKHSSALPYVVADLAQRYYIDMAYFKREYGLNNKNAAPALILAALNGSLPVSPSQAAQLYQEALDIFETYFTPVQPTPQATTTTKTDIPGFSASTSTTGKKTIPGF